MPSKHLELYVGMVGAVAGIGVVTVGFLAGTWGVFYAILTFLEIGSPAMLSAGITAIILLTVGYLEYRQVDTIERFADAQTVSRDTAPELYETATRIAAQLDVPVPRIAIAERDVPEALAVGFRPDAVHLVLSRGTLEALEGTDELEAVLAHELAHVKNRDAMIMTAVSLPVVLAEGLGTRVSKVENPGWGAIVVVPLAFLSTVVWVIGRTIVARLSRVRERAADRAAAEATGSPAALASALQRLDRNIAETPNQDLRAVAGVSSLSILSLEPDDPEKVMLGPDGETEPSYWWLRKRLHRIERRLFDTHPPTRDRIEALSAEARRREQTKK
ncbi:M48 family metalloprotease [Natronomonas sp. CBA1123]|uniref:M48 family metalloprotease n=1 Tax=Natronomonas sp. CBA1123 TaxID=2668070 RepID=UPI0012E9D294|nr:M48 family metalloprotease [Natronomonas sp. CBA1123]MUV85213.1 M48 family metalloprotease [Natronomonas sp. CBA1123]